MLLSIVSITPSRSAILSETGGTPMATVSYTALRIVTSTGQIWQTSSSWCWTTAMNASWAKLVSRGRATESWSPNRLLKLVGMETLGPLPDTRTGNRCIVVIVVRYIKIALAILSSKSTASHVLPMFFYQWVLPYMTPSFLFTPKSTQFVSKILKSLSTLQVRISLPVHITPKQTGRPKDIAKPLLHVCTTMMPNTNATGTYLFGL